MQLLDIKKKYFKKLKENNCQSRTLHPRISILKNKTKQNQKDGNNNKKSDMLYQNGLT